MVPGGGLAFEGMVGANECPVAIEAKANGVPKVITNKLIADGMPEFVANIATEGIANNAPVVIANISSEPIASPKPEVIANGTPVVISDSAPVLIAPVGIKARAGANNNSPVPVVLITDKSPEFNANELPEFNADKLPDFNANIALVVTKVKSRAGLGPTTIL
ncbi:hypothetical protein PGTUg99_024359 [Puccinia graminis f. sp. tritici]|uniref:Uncharacterized protein n=2 Tax=Puccinia graminis f. sp. tritici TaxID=56615 RepID=E3KG40_PUCGT|nr:uncharacterized protein PGTG_09107 [Puccinia graminis f. sp. tritici CRL 75-36-700-3]EFP83154.1 hypothetical protein PGTG_09107 [Puccinia graminis f. sp. tritici CRL 75-36-700-3]KAA1128824.1 hypothetical protein PGTUg99_024359 [Puccinia graminis f. sp. tritici]